MKNSKDISKLNLNEKIWEESWVHVKTDVMDMAESLAEHANRVENQFAERIKKVEVHIIELEKKVNKLKK